MKIAVIRGVLRVKLSMDSILQNLSILRFF